MKRIISYILILGMLFSTVSLPDTVYASGVKAKSVISRIYVNGAYQPTEAYMIKSEYYYKLQDIAASVRDLSVRFTFVKNNNNTKITMGKNHTMNGTEYSASDLLSYSVGKGGEVQVDGSVVTISGYMINGNYCLTMKEAAKLLSCGYKTVEKGKGTDYQLMTSYQYNATGKLERKLNQQGNTAFNRMWEGFAASSKDSIYFVSSGTLYKMNNEGTQIKTLLKGYVTNLNLINERLYYTVGGQLYSMDLDGNDKISHEQALYADANQYMQKTLIVDDSVYCIYNDYDRWANPKNTSNLYQFEMIGRDMIVDTWQRQTIFSIGNSSVWDNRIATFYLEDDYLYFTGLWVNRAKLGEFGNSYTREVLAEGEWYQQQKYSDDLIIMMGNQGKNSRWPGKNGYLYTKSVSDKNNWSLYLKEAVYTYTVTDDKLIYIKDYDLFIRDLDGRNKTQLLGQDGSSTVLFGIAGDWIVARSSSDVANAKTTLIKLDGTKPSVKY